MIHYIIELKQLNLKGQRVLYKFIISMDFVEIYLNLLTRVEIALLQFRASWLILCVVKK